MYKLLFYVNYGIIIVAFSYFFYPKLGVNNFKKEVKEMLESTIAAILFYALIVTIIGVLVNLTPVAATLMAFGICCMAGAYFARQSRFVRHMCQAIGGICFGLFAMVEFLLPMLRGQKALLITVSVLIGVAVYLISRVFTYRRFVRRRVNGQTIIPQPPHGKEWLRWLCFILV